MGSCPKLISVAERLRSREPVRSLSAAHMFERTGYENKKGWWWGNVRICLTQYHLVRKFPVVEQRRHWSLLDLTDKTSGERMRN